MQKNSSKFLFYLSGLYLILFTFLAINPIERHTWFVENLTVWIILAFIYILYFLKIRFSNTAYLLMFVLIYLHTIGGHYTFALVPFDFVTNLFGFTRNHFDRIAHFSVGFYAYAVAEWIYMKKLVNNKFLLFTYPVFLIATIAMSYELVEWVYAAQSSATDAMAYLGSQGDIWDAQKDMLADTLGGIFSMIVFFIVHKLWNKNNNI
jgi:putative membrane protein